MSNRAVEAYNDGERPFSKWSKTDIIFEIERLNPNIIDLIKKVNLNNLKSIFMDRSSWHHTSSFCNATDFYSLNNERITTITKEEIEFILAEQNEQKKNKVVKSKPQFITALVTFENWEGTRAHPKKIKYTESVKYMSDSKIVATSVGNKRLSSLTILKNIVQKTKFANEIKS